ncbi:MAG: TIGR03905 family TSCPD domain-containing protein [Vallitaleaceae bacterium]|nr:TIGR03905 family TSCPD domain-containing protein [Vallitaleaceae bacterium]
MFEYKSKGTCSTKILFDVEGNKLKNVQFINGCPGNLLGISQLVDGLTIEAVIEKFDGISCGGRPTSCPDQLAAALKKWKKDQETL